MVFDSSHIRQTSQQHKNGLGQMLFSRHH